MDFVSCDRHGWPSCPKSSSVFFLKHEESLYAFEFLHNRNVELYQRHVDKISTCYCAPIHAVA